MTDLRPRRPSPALIVAILALIVALGGSAFAASYVITSSKQIKPRVITGKHVKKGSLGPELFKGSNVTVRTVEGTIPAGGAQEEVKASCEEGEKATGGGYADAGSVIVVTSRPEPETGTPRAWVVEAYDATFPGAETKLPVYVVCTK